MTSPLTFGDRLARYTLEAIRFGQESFQYRGNADLRRQCAHDRRNGGGGG